MSNKVIRWRTVDGECVTHHAVRADDGGEQCIRCHAFSNALHVGFLCSECFGRHFGESPVGVTMTPQERQAIEWASNMLDDINRGDKEKSAVLRGLLERTR